MVTQEPEENRPLPLIVPFEDKGKSLRGNRISLEPSDPLAQEALKGFPSRSIEVGEILRWAGKRNIQLMEEFYVETPNNEKKDFHVVTYTHIMHPQEQGQGQPREKPRAKKTLAGRETEGLGIW
jgi:hypothetical protein